ncbi:MAG: sensor histidine kinase [Chryseotalea sp.]
MNVYNKEFFLVFLIGLAIVLLLAFTIIVFVIAYQKRMLNERLKREKLEVAYQQKMLEATLISQENERARIATDLHDSVGAMLSTIRLTLHAAESQLNENNLFANSKQMLDETIETIRRISRDLLPVNLERFGLSQTLQEMAERITQSGKINVLFREEGEKTSLKKEREVQVFRIIQELLNNSLKHAEATEIVLHLWWSDTLVLLVKDNGKGFELPKEENFDETKTGVGLHSINLRTKLLEGTLTIKTEKQKGSEFSITLPL